MADMAEGLWAELEGGRSPLEQGPADRRNSSNRGLRSNGRRLGISAEQRSDLARAIELEIIPRLVLAHRAPPEPVPFGGGCDSPGSEQVKLFAELILTDEVQDACGRVDALRRTGRSLESIYIELISPAARHLRMLWQADLCDLANCALGLWRLQQVIREFSTEFRCETPHQQQGYRTLLLSAPGEKSELGYVMFDLAMASEFYRRDGWDTWVEPEPAGSEFLALVRGQWFDIVEFHVDSDKNLNALTSAIRLIRREAPNRTVGVMLRGQIFVEKPELILVVGGDIAAMGAGRNALQAKTLVQLLANRS